MAEIKSKSRRHLEIPQQLDLHLRKIFQIDVGHALKLKGIAWNIERHLFFSSFPPKATLFLYPTDDKYLVNIHVHTSRTGQAT